MLLGGRELIKNSGWEKKMLIRQILGVNKSNLVLMSFLYENNVIRMFLNFHITKKRSKLKNYFLL